MIGSKDFDDATNIRIVISGNTRAVPNTGNIEYVATAGNHMFYTGAKIEKLRIADDGTLLLMMKL